jgi:hypothetical protein
MAPTPASRRCFFIDARDIFGLMFINGENEFSRPLIKHLSSAMKSHEGAAAQKARNAMAFLFFRGIHGHNQGPA